MEGTDLKIVVEKKGEEALDFTGDEEPVSPTGLYLNSSALSLSILGFFESEVPINDSATMETLEKDFLPINSRFSSIMVRDRKGLAKWKKVKVKLEDHVNIPVFPPGLNSYDEHLQDYISNLAMEQLPQNRPLWSLHLIKYPTKNAEGMMIFKLHHALGDGYSLMSAIFSCIKRFDDPSKPLTFPPPKRDIPTPVKNKCLLRAPRILSFLVNSVADFGWGLLKTTVLEDDRSAVRSGTPGVEFLPFEVSSVSFSLDDIKQIKSKLGATVNDVITGVVFYGVHMYMRSAERQAKRKTKVTALVLLNTRMVNNYQTLTEMSRTNTKGKWGNNFAFLHVRLPACKDGEDADPLEFVAKARRTIKAKRNSLAVGLTGYFLDMMRKIRGPEAASRYIHKTLRNTSMAITNLIGPVEKMGIAGHSCRSLYFAVVGAPQSLSICVMSYMGKLKVAFGTEKGYIDSGLLISCMEKSFTNIHNAAVSK